MNLATAARIARDATDTVKRKFHLLRVTSRLLVIEYQCLPTEAL
jgi:hypothetical protein